MNRRSRLLFAKEYSYLPQTAGGSESSTHEMCLALMRRGYRVAVLSGLHGNDPVGVMNRISRRINPSRSFPFDRVMGYPVYRGWEPRDGVSEVVKDFSPSVIIIQYLGEGSLSLLNSLLAEKIPVICYFRNLEFGKSGATLPSSSLLKFVANSIYTANRVRDYYGVDADVLYPLVDPARYRTRTKRRRVIFINPIQEKGVEIALNLAGNRPDVPFDFIESWRSNEKVLEMYRDKAKHLSNIRWRKRVRDARKVYRDARMVLMPSLYEEAWGRVATEAHTSGIPILASDSGGLPESVGQGGIIVKKTAPITEWLDAFSRMWDDRSAYEKLVRAAVSYSARPEIDPARVLEKFVSIINDHLGGLHMTPLSGRSG